MAYSRLKQVRLERGLTQQRIADLVGVCEKSYRDWENGKVIPNAASIQYLCNIFGMTARELGLSQRQEQGNKPFESTQYLTEYFDYDPSLRLFDAVAMGHGNLWEIQKSVQSALLEFDMNRVTRRDVLHDALLRLGAIAVAPFADKSLDYYAASIVACQQLSKSQSVKDLTFAYQAVTEILRRLEPLTEIPTTHNRTAIDLASQAARLRQNLSRHIKGPETAVQCARQTILYAQKSGNVQEQVMALDSLGWAYSAMNPLALFLSPEQNLLALNAANEAILLLKEHSKEIPLYVHGYLQSGLAVMQARNGQPCHDAIHNAEQLATADHEYIFLVDDELCTIVIDRAEALMHIGDYAGAMNALSQYIDPTSLQAKYALSGRAYVRALLNILVASLRSDKRDLDYSILVWEKLIENAKSMGSKQRFNDAIITLGIMGTIWPKEAAIQKLQPWTLH